MRGLRLVRELTHFESGLESSVLALSVRVGSEHDEHRVAGAHNLRKKC